MTPELTLAAIVVIPVIALLVLRINATLVFLSLCLGDVLVQFVATDANQFVSLISNSSSSQIHTSDDWMKIGLLILPVILTAVFMIRTVRGAGRLTLNALPAVGVGLLGALLVVPLLPPGLSHNIVDSSLWEQVTRAQNLIVGTSALICLLVLWLQRPKTGGGKHGKH